MMMIFKSIVLGLGIFIVGTIAYLEFKLQTLPPLSGTYVARGFDIGTFLNIWICCMWLVVSFALGYCVARQFRARA